VRIENKGKVGAIIAVGASAQLVKQSIEQLGQAAAARIAIACYNSPSSLTVSGDLDAVTDWEQRLKNKMSGIDLFGLEGLRITRLKCCK
jgi:acyl transferase domain-containing protein